MCFLWEIQNIQGESTRYMFKASQKDPWAHRQIHYTAQQIEEVGAWSWKFWISWRSSESFSRNQVTSSLTPKRLLAHSGSLILVRTQSDGNSRENRFVLLPTHHSPDPFGASKAGFHPPSGSKFHVSRAMKSQGRLGANLDCADFSHFDSDKPWPRHSRL